MDISSPSLVPRAVADLRPSADAAATARIAEPPAALAHGLAVAPASPALGGLVARGLLGARPVAPAGRTDGAALGTEHPPPRVLKPWNVPMLPAEEERATPGQEGQAPAWSADPPGPDGPGAQGADGRGSEVPGPSLLARPAGREERGPAPDGTAGRGDAPPAGSAMDPGMPPAASTD